MLMMSANLTISRGASVLSPSGGQDARADPESQTRARSETGRRTGERLRRPLQRAISAQLRRSGSLSRNVRLTSIRDIKSVVTTFRFGSI